MPRSFMLLGIFHEGDYVSILENLVGLLMSETQKTMWCFSVPHNFLILYVIRFHVEAYAYHF